MEKRKSLQGYLLIFLAGCLWGLGGYLVTQLSQMGVSSMLAAFSGHFFTLLPLLIILISKNGIKGLKISKKGLIFSIIMGALTKGIFKLANDGAVTMVGVASASVLMYLAPIFTAMMSMLFFKEKLRGYQHVALLLNLVGCVLMVTGGNFTSLSLSGLGLILGVSSAFLYALYTILGKVSMSDDNPITMTFYMLLFSAITTSFFAKPWLHLDLFTNSNFLFWAILNSLITGLLANLFFLQGLSRNVDASKVTVITSFEVIVATLTGIFLLNEQINYIGLIGIVTMVASIVLMNTTIREKVVLTPEIETLSSQESK